MGLDRAYQRELLEMLAQVYPDSLDNREVFAAMDAGEEARYMANMYYLQEHELVYGGIQSLQWGSPYISALPKITAKGLDFLADDGGLSAILGVVTIKIHDETLRQLIGQHIERIPGTEADKGRLRKALEGLTASASKTLLDRLIGLGVEHLPTTAASLHTWLLTVMR